MKLFNKQALKRMKTILPATAFGRPYTQVVHANGEHVEITDGYFWCKVQNPNKLRGQYDKEALNRFIVANVDQPLYEEKDSTWPNTGALLTGNEEHLFKVNADILSKALSILTADSTKKAIEFRKDINGSIVLKHETGNIGMLAPMADET